MESNQEASSSLPIEPESDDTGQTEEMNKVYRKLIEIFPNTLSDYLRFQAKNISGNPGALELFIDRHLQNDSQPSNDWKQEDQRISEELEFQSQQFWLQSQGSWQCVHFYRDSVS